MGELAALGAALCWSIAPILFTISGKKASSTTINRLRLLLSCFFLFCTHVMVLGLPSPSSMGLENMGWLALSGVLGLAFGDTCLLKAFLLIGPRLVTLIMTLVPLFSSILGFVLYGERFQSVELFGAVLCISGVVFVVASHVQGIGFGGGEHLGKGVGLAVLAALGQSLGLICAKQGLQSELPVLSAVLIRMTAAMLIMWLLQGFGKRLHEVTQLDKKTLGLILAGTVIGPFLGVWLSMQAIELTRVGLAATLMALTPILILPFSYFILKEQVTIRALVGSLIALAGVVLILQF